MKLAICELVFVLSMTKLVIVWLLGTNDRIKYSHAPDWLLIILDVEKITPY